MSGTGLTSDNEVADAAALKFKTRVENTANWVWDNKALFLSVPVLWLVLTTLIAIFYQDHYIDSLSYSDKDEVKDAVKTLLQSNVAHVGLASFFCIARIMYSAMYTDSDNNPKNVMPSVLGMLHNYFAFVTLLGTTAVLALWIIMPSVAATDGGSGTVDKDDITDEQTFAFGTFTIAVLASSAQIVGDFNLRKISSSAMNKALSTELTNAPPSLQAAPSGPVVVGSV